MNIIKYRQEIIPALLLLLLATLFLGKVILHPDKMIYSHDSDLIDMGYPYYYLADSILKTGNIPFWNPSIHCGRPLIGNPNFALFYPLNILFFILPTHLAFGYLYLLHIFMGGLFIYLFARYINLDKSSSFISGIIFMFCGSMVLRIYAGHYSLIINIIWLPLVFLFLEIALNKRSLFYGLLTGVPIALQLLGGHPQLSFYMLLALGLYFLFRAFFIIKQERNYKIISRLCLIFLLSLVIGLLLSAIQLIPCLEFLSCIIRKQGTLYDFTTMFSFPLRNFITLILPDFFGNPSNYTYWGSSNYWEFSLYIGIFPLILVFLSICFKRNNRLVLFFTALAFLSLLLALGKNTPIYWLMWKFVPGFNLFRAPARFLFLFSFAASILAGFGFSFLKQDFTLIKKTRERIWGLLVIVAIITLLLGLIRYIISDQLVQPFYSIITQDLFAMSAFFIASAILITARIKNKIQVKYFNLMSILLILFNLWFYYLGFIEAKNLQEIYPEPDYISFLKKHSAGYRVLVYDKEIRNNFQTIYGIATINGYEAAGLELRDYLTMLNTSPDRPFLMNLLNVKYILSSLPLDHSGLKLVFNQSGTYIYENKQVLPKAFVIQDNKEIKEARVKKYSPNCIILEANITQPGVLILSEVYYPAWKAYVDGKQQRVNKAYHALRSVRLLPGQHTVKFIYDPYLLMISLWITLLPLISLVVIVIIRLSKKGLTDRISC